MRFLERLVLKMLLVLKNYFLRPYRRDCEPLLLIKLSPMQSIKDKYTAIKASLELDIINTNFKIKELEMLNETRNESILLINNLLKLADGIESAKNNG